MVGGMIREAALLCRIQDRGVQSGQGSGRLECVFIRVEKLMGRPAGRKRRVGPGTCALCHYWKCVGR
eukprot:2370751-Rhodomonas_salina.1